MKSRLIFDFLESHLRLSKATISHSYVMRYQYCTPSSNMIMSHPTRYLSVGGD